MVTILLSNDYFIFIEAYGSGAYGRHGNGVHYYTVN